ncbi:MAG: hypothetical protein ACXWFJ_04865, partial [Candidatus Aminicenantales bacterium]
MRSPTGPRSPTGLRRTIGLTSRSLTSAPKKSRWTWARCRSGRKKIRLSGGRYRSGRTTSPTTSG